MPVTAFHLSSASAEATANGSTVADFTLPLRPPLQIPATAQPTAYLSSLLFPNELANCTAATKTSTVTMGLGNALTEFSNAGAGRPYWVGFQYTSADGNTTNQVCVPLTKDLSLPTAWEWPGIAEAGPTGGIHGMVDVFIVQLINDAVQNALNITAWHSATGQTTEMMPLPGSTGHGIMRTTKHVTAKTLYVSGGADLSGTLVFNLAFGASGVTDAEETSMLQAFNDRAFRFMSQAEIRAYLSTNGPAGYTSAKALSITDVLGIQIDPTGTDYQTRMVFGQDVLYPSVNEGWQASVAADQTVTIPDMAASLEDLEKAISREVLANHKAEIWDKVQGHLTDTTLADPDKPGQWTANQAQTTVGTTTYEKLIALSADISTNRVSLRTAGPLQITNDGGTMMTELLGFAPDQLGDDTEAEQTIVARNAAKIDKTRAVVFHCPSLGGGSYSTAGRQGGSALQLVPITAPLGAVQVWETSNPIRVECGISGSTLAELRCYLTTEDGDPIELLGDRWESVLVLEY